MVLYIVLPAAAADLRGTAPAERWRHRKERMSLPRRASEGGSLDHVTGL
uniref:Uncharacterized protein n=1 Tax=uncultured Nocardioidaceae bacterium TaxID=253824 RepID=A0A6J4LKQ2_9ACTN|nr:MAG: hypothetical protein AVDCRST_MAG46-1551 [uncultured Nocardioidaceae bacterium]